MASNDPQGLSSPTERSAEPKDISNARVDALNANNITPPSSTPVEMSTLQSQPRSNAEPTENTPTPPAQSSNPNPSRENQTSMSNSAAENSSSPSRDPLQPVSTNATSPSTLDRKVSTAIGPSTDQPTPISKDPEVAGPSLVITLLLTTGARHPFKIDEKYLKKRNVNVTENDPFNLSVYTLKELIWREWREGMYLRIAMNNKSF
jgi:hypothetical protein